MNEDTRNHKRIGDSLVASICSDAPGMIAQYGSFVTVKRMAARYHVSRTTLYKILRDAGIHIPRKRKDQAEETAAPIVLNFPDYDEIPL